MGKSTKKDVKKGARETKDKGKKRVSKEHSKKKVRKDSSSSCSSSSSSDEKPEDVQLTETVAAAFGLMLGCRGRVLCAD